MKKLIFYHPEPRPESSVIRPVFIPFAGCPRRCVFCAQEKQTGRTAAPNPAPEDLLRGLFAAPPPEPVELAFYGGTFTALPRATQTAFMRLAAKLMELGRVRSVRCSTRPDALTATGLRELKALGLQTVELGVQSFSDRPLAAAGRGYDGSTARRACRMVQDAGLSLGVQLMPGMPGMRPENFLADVESCLEIRPALARLYPCLVLEGTILADIWRQGRYVPWSLDEVLHYLPGALLDLWSKGIRVIRMGLAPQKELAGSILAGPAHPALGQRLRSRALFRLLSDKLCELRSGGDCGAQPDSREQTIRPGQIFLNLPRRYQGEFFGYRGDLKQDYAALGLGASNLHWGEQEHFELVCTRAPAEA